MIILDICTLCCETGVYSKYFFLFFWLVRALPRSVEPIYVLIQKFGQSCGSCFVLDTPCSICTQAAVTLEPDGGS